MAKIINLKDNTQIILQAKNIQAVPSEETLFDSTNVQKALEDLSDAIVDLGDPNFIESITTEETSENGGTNTITITDTAGTQTKFHVKNGEKGEQGNSGYSGAAGELEVVNNLTDGGATSALSAEMGKELKEIATKYTYPAIDVSVGNNTGAIVPASTGHVWSTGTSYKGRCFDVSGKRGWKLRIRHGDSFATCNFAFLNATPANNQPISYCDGETYHSGVSVEVVTVPSDATLLYVQRVSGGGNVMTPVVEILTKDKDTMYGLSNAIETLKDLEDEVNEAVAGVDNIVKCSSLASGTLKVLAIGNSWSQDAFFFLPYVFGVSNPDLTLTLGVAMDGSQNLKGHCDKIDNTAWSARYSSYNKWDGSSWTNYNGASGTANEKKSLAGVITDEEWDYIIFQGLAAESCNLDVIDRYLPQLVGYARDLGYTGKTGWLLLPSHPEGTTPKSKRFLEDVAASLRLDYTPTTEEVQRRLIYASRHALKHVDVVVPCGAGIAYARNTWLGTLGGWNPSDGRKGNLFYTDGNHLNYGSGNIIESWVAAMFFTRGKLNVGKITNYTWPNPQFVKGSAVGVSEDAQAVARDCAYRAYQAWTTMDSEGVMKEFLDDLEAGTELLFDIVDNEKVVANAQQANHYQISADTMCHTDYVDIEGESIIYVTAALYYSDNTNYNTGIEWLDANKTRVRFTNASYWRSEKGVHTLNRVALAVGSGEKYVRITTVKSVVPVPKIWTPSSLREELDESWSKVEELSGAVSTMEVSVGALDGIKPGVRLSFTVNTGKLVTSGSVSTSGYYQYSDYIDVHELSIFYFTGRLQVHTDGQGSDSAIVFYDSEKVKVRAITMRTLSEWDGTTGVKALDRRALRVLSGEWYVRVSNVPSADYPGPVVEAPSTLRSELDASKASSQHKGFPHRYMGEPIVLEKVANPFVMYQLKNKSDFAPSSYDNANQSGAYYGGYYFRVYNLVRLVDVYDIANGWARQAVEIDYNGYGDTAPHANMSSFGSERYAPTDEFPLLYVSRDGMGSYVQTGGLDAYRVVHDTVSDTWRMTLVQRISYAHAVGMVVNGEDQTAWQLRPSVSDGCMYISQYALPALSAGDCELGERLRRITVPLPPSPVVNKRPIHQDGFIQDGMLYLLVGGADRDIWEGGVYQYTDHTSALWVIDLALGELVSAVELWRQGMSGEPESGFIHDGSIFVDTLQHSQSSDPNTAYGGLWRLVFPTRECAYKAYHQFIKHNFENSHDYVLLRSSDGSVWRLGVGTDGELSTTPLN